MSGPQISSAELDTSDIGGLPLATLTLSTNGLQHNAIILEASRSLAQLETSTQNQIPLVKLEYTMPLDESAHINGKTDAVTVSLPQSFSTSLMSVYQPYRAINLVIPSRLSSLNYPNTIQFATTNTSDINSKSNILNLVEFLIACSLDEFHEARTAQPPTGAASNTTAGPTAPLQLSETWSLEESTLHQVKYVLMLATSKWHLLDLPTEIHLKSMRIPDLHRVRELFRLLPGMTNLCVATGDNVFDKDHIVNFQTADEGHFWRALILKEHGIMLKEEIERRIVQDRSLPPCLRAATLMCKVMAVDRMKDWNKKRPLLLAEDFEPVGLVEGEYKDKSLTRPSPVSKLSLPVAGS
ncbi:hypothetical protein ONS95_004587 [Cadophora gregata]|uniref:uncharacterized protein n=1 Tax=Cadophora gregata TaxID=51156 RepID=UPI0026DA9596|nr:uncharacterized protein ONS95_004587 [Cadophora gregata]KAK0105045.1 hypothetical protein ONS96_004450 [Cadophora gregata f. sp. sojae]KAK0106083.1 hypothetical protein ONS95_004587 [Cadophora gregata]